jgi:putative flippase GtrA
MKNPENFAGMSIYLSANFNFILNSATVFLDTSEIHLISVINFYYIINKLIILVSDSD